MPPEEHPPIIPTRLASPEEEAWLEHQRQTRQETPARLEEAAKFVSGMISVTFAIFLAPNAEAFKGQEYDPLLIAAVGGWLLSLLAALWVIFPQRYRVADDSAQSIQRMHERVVRWKYAFLAAAVGLYLVALLLTAMVYF